MMEENQFERKPSLDIDSSPVTRTSRRAVPTQTGVPPPAKHCMHHNLSNTALGVTTCVTVVEAQLRENEKKKFLIKEDRAVPCENPQTIPVAVRPKASRLLESRV